MSSFVTGSDFPPQLFDTVPALPHIRAMNILSIQSWVAYGHVGNASAVFPLQRLGAEVWTPIRFTPQRLTQRRNNYLLTFGRLAPGATVASAQSELRGIFGNLVAANQDLQGENVRVAPLHARKMTALMQADAANAPDKPILLLYDTKSGHSGGRPVGKQIAEGTNILSFLFWQLGVK